MTISSQEQWDAVAAAYDEIVGTDRDIVYATLKKDLWDVLGPLDGKLVLDLGCGSGWFAALMANRGARVTGVDGSVALLELARTRYPDQSWSLQDLTAGLRPSEPYDLIVSNMVLMDFDPIDPVVADVSRRLRRNGRVVVTMPHPAFFNYALDSDEAGSFRKVREYLSFEKWHIATYGGHTHFHRPLSYYINLFASHQLYLRQFREPNYKGNMPGFCVMEFVCVA